MVLICGCDCDCGYTAMWKIAKKNVVDTAAIAAAMWL